MIGDHPQGKSQVVPATVAAIVKRVAVNNLLFGELLETLSRVGDVVDDLKKSSCGESPARATVKLTNYRQLCVEFFFVFLSIAPVIVSLRLTDAKFVAFAHTTSGAAVTLLRRRESLGMAGRLGRFLNGALIV